MLDFPNGIDWSTTFQRYRWRGRFHERVLDTNSGPFAADSLSHGWPFIAHLEERGRGLAETVGAGRPLDEQEAREFIAEVIMWGGSQRGLLGRFRRGNPATVTQVAPLLRAVVKACLKRELVTGDVEQALDLAMQIRFIGQTYGSKLLRFIDPARFPAIDSRINAFYGTRVGLARDPARGYGQWWSLVGSKTAQLSQQGEAVPGAPWTAARVEMAAFQFASERLAQGARPAAQTRAAPERREQAGADLGHDAGVFHTLGGRKRPFMVEDLGVGTYRIVPAAAGVRPIQMTRGQVEALLRHFEGQGWFPLANNVVRLRDGTEDARGLGRYVVDQLGCAGTLASQIGAWLHQAGLLEWNGAVRRIQFQVAADWTEMFDSDGL